ncbi:MACPF domain-containing protein At1g14780-like [Cucurbita maxima]|uniref:MACPF domain-containing protein At1g14780-like n=1 Tax=Cucurbita maxima TaxID=3661 RepID=A0A6J1KTM0_CUCMA|nr:MACPF domain-containing protein At1g14780-like [Cucurbita maxima]
MISTEKPVEARALECLGRGFDLTNDFRLKFVKGSGAGGRRLVVIDDVNKRDIVFPDGGVVQGVSQDIRCDKGDRIRFKSDVLQFNQMSELLNQRSSIQGKVPSGYFNSMFNLSGDWFHDAADANYLAFDGYFIALCYLHLTASPLVLQDEVKKAVPSNWDPASLSRFIQTYGTHIIVGTAIGGQDLISVRQRPSSSIPPAELRRHLEDLGDILFSDKRSPSSLHRKRDVKVPEIFTKILQSSSIQLANISETSSKDGITLICSKRGGDPFLHSHTSWLQTVSFKPEVILFKFVPITSLLTGVAGSGYLSHAINLYLRYKPSLNDLQYFLEFQIPTQWAPNFCELPLGHQRRKATCPTLQFTFMSPRTYITSTQVTSSRKPLVGLRLYLEGKKSNWLALHVQHLTSLPKVMARLIGTSDESRRSQWIGTDDSDSNGRFLEPVKWKRYSNVCTSVVRHDPNWLKQDVNGVYIVTGAQLISKGKWPKTILHLRLQFTHLPNCTIRRTEWAAAPEGSRKSTFLTNLSTTFTFTQRAAADKKKQVPGALNSGVYGEAPPVPVRSKKLLKYVDTSEVVKGPHDTPGHWLVTAAKLVTEGGKIGLNVKFALLDYC